MNATGKFSIKILYANQFSPGGLRYQIGRDVFLGNFRAYLLEDELFFARGVELENWILKAAGWWWWWLK